MTQPNVRKTSVPDEKDEVKTQRFQLPVRTKEDEAPNHISPVHFQLPMGKDEDEAQNHISPVDTNAQDLFEYFSGDDILEAAMAENWVRIFEYFHPNHMQALAPYRESNQRLIAYLRRWFATSKLHDFLQLDAIACDPDMGAFQGYPGTELTLQGKTDYSHPDKTYASFDDWFSDTEKPEGYIFDEETHQLVLYTEWLTNDEMAT